MIFAIGAAVCIATHHVERSFAPTLARHTFREITMGCEVRIDLAAASEEEAAAAARLGFARIRSLDECLSDYVPSSETRRLDLSAQTSVVLSNDLCETLRRALALAHATGGAFDPTCGSIATLWRDARRSGQLPAPSAIAAARLVCGYEHLSLDPSDCSLHCAVEGIELDFGGIGKGLAAQSARDAIAKAGVDAVLVAVSGDVACGSAPPWGSGWTVEICTGIDGDERVRLSVVNACLSTSGDSEQHIYVDGVRHSHIFDPRTGEAITTRRAATVLSRDGALSDALATALTVNPSLIDPSTNDLHARLGSYEARVVSLDAAGSLTAATTAGWGVTTPSGLTVLSEDPRAARELQRAPAGADQTAGPKASTAAVR